MPRHHRHTVPVITQEGGNGAILILAEYDSSGMLLETHMNEIISQETGEDEIAFSLKNDVGKISYLKAFLIASDGSASPLCASVSYQLNE